MAAQCHLSSLISSKRRSTAPRKTTSSATAETMPIATYPSGSRIISSNNCSMALGMVYCICSITHSEGRIEPSAAAATHNNTNHGLPAIQVRDTGVHLRHINQQMLDIPKRTLTAAIIFPVSRGSCCRHCSAS